MEQRFFQFKKKREVFVFASALCQLYLEIVGWKYYSFGHGRQDFSTAYTTHTVISGNDWT